MGWFRKSYDIHALARSHDEGLMRSQLSGRALDVRDRYDPWRIPLDHAATAGNATLVRVLLELGSPLLGSSIHEAIKKDADQVLEAMRQHDPRFWLQFRTDKQRQANPRLNRWTQKFTALDFARSIGASRCSELLERAGAAGGEFRQCRNGCVGVFVGDAEFVVVGGVNLDGRALQTCGYYCAKCEAFQNW